MTLPLTWFVFGVIMAHAPWPAASGPIFTDLTWAEVIKKSEKCSRCAPGRPCMVEAMPKLPVTNNFDLEYAEFLTDDELNAKYTGQKDFCDCTKDLWGGIHWQETPERGCGEIHNQLCEGENNMCKGFEPCVNYSLSFYCTCNDPIQLGQLCNLPPPSKAPLWAFVYRPVMVPFMTSPTFAPYQTDWIRGIVMVYNQLIPIPPEYPLKLPAGYLQSKTGFGFCAYYSFDDGRDFCAESSTYVDPTIWHKEVFGVKKKHNTREDCYKDIDKRSHFLDKYLCDMLPDGLSPRFTVPVDYWFRVDLNPDNEDTITIPGDPLPIGRRFKMRLVSSNTLERNRGKHRRDYAYRFSTWRFAHGSENFTDPLPYIGFYQLHFRQCTFVFTYTGCSEDQVTQPVYNQHQEIVIQAYQHQHPGTKGCETMVPVDNRWNVHIGTDYREHGKGHIREWTLTPDPFPLSKDYGQGIGPDSFICRIRYEDFKHDDEYATFANMIVVHDFVQQGHPRKHVSREVGLEYQTRQLCYFQWVPILEIVLPESELISQNCDKGGDLVLKITRPFYFYEPLLIEWRCIDPPTPADPCTKVRTTGSKSNKFHEYQDFKYDGALECRKYTWEMKVKYLSRTSSKENTYNIIIERSREVLPEIKMQSLSASNKTRTVDPREPNYFRIVTTPHKPDIWGWNLYKILDRSPSGAMKKTPVTEEWQQPLTSTYIGIIEPNKLEEDAEYILIGESKGGRASYTFRANSPPKGDPCTITPKFGIAGETKFKVHCQKFTDDQGPLSYKVVESEDLEEMPWLQYNSFKSGYSINCEVQVFSNKLAVLVFDDEGMHIRIPLEVDLKDPTKPPEDILDFLFKSLPEKVVKDKLDAVEEMGRYTRFFDRLKIPFEEDQKIEFMAGLSQAVNVDSVPNVFVRGMMVLRNLFINQLEKNRTITDRVLKAGGEQLHNFADIFVNPQVVENMKYYDQKLIQKVFTYIAALILQHPDPVVVDDTIREDEHEAHKIRASQGSYHALHALELVGVAKRNRQYFQLQPTFNSTQRSITMLVQANNATTFNDEFSPDRIEGHTMTVSQEMVNKYKGKAIFSVMIASEENLFWWLPNNAGILSVMAQVDEGTLHKTRNWKRVEGPVNIYVKLKNFTKNTKTADGILKPVPKCFSRRKLERSLSVHHFKVPEGEGVVYMQFEKQLIGQIKVFTGSNVRPTHEKVSGTPLLSSESLARNYSNLDPRSQSDFYVAILYTAKGASVAVPYSMKYKIVQCTNYIYSKFEARGCSFRQFLENTTDSPRIWCECSHLSWFSASIELPQDRIVLPEHIHLFSRKFNNFVIVTLLAAILLLFILLLIWGIKKDQLDARERHVIVLMDNWCTDTYPYIVAVYTGESCGSGTTSKVSIRVFGKNGHSRVHLLSHPSRRVLKIGQDDWFLMKTQKPLGKLRMIQMWHNHSGFSPEWYCKKVVIYDLKTEEISTFIVERWFTFDHRVSLGEARMQEVEILKPEEASSKWHYFVAGWVFTELRDKHTWASILTRHPRNLYTRCQRVVIAFGIILSTMLVSMIFFDFDTGPFDWPSLEFSWKYIWTGIKSVIMSTVVMLIVMYCFRRSKAQTASKLKKQQEEGSATPGKDGGANEKADKKGLVKVIKTVVKPKPFQPVTLKKNKNTERNKDIEKSKEEKSKEIEKIKDTEKSKGPDRIFLILAWTLAISVIVICSFFLILYGLKFGKKKSFVWIFTFLSGIVTKWIIFEPLKIIFIAIVLSFLFRTSKSDTFFMEVRHEEVQQGDVDMKKCLKRMWNTRMKSPYHPVSTPRILKIRARYGSRRFMYMIYYGITLLLLLCIIYMLICALGVKHSYFGLKQITSDFREESDQLKTKESMYKLFHYNVIPALHKVHWYNKREPLPLEDKIKISSVFNNYFKQAYGKYFEFREDKKPYMPEWMTRDERKGDISQLWRYSSVKSTKTGYNYGPSGWVYSGGGYVMPLSWNLGNSWRTITRLEMEKWTDNRTRAVFFEANLYNNNLKLFTEIRIIVEVLPNGVYMSRLQSRATSLFYKTKPEAEMIIVYSACMAAVLMLYGLFVFIQISQDGFTVYCSQLRGYLDILVIFLGVSCIIHFIGRALQFSLFLEYLYSAPHDAYTSLYTPYKVDEETHVIFGLFTLITAMAITALIYQATWPKRFYFVFSEIIGPLTAVILINITMSYLIHYTSYSIDRDPLKNYLLHSALREQRFTGKGDETNTRILYIILLPFIVVLLKFNVACVIFLHLWYSEHTKIKKVTPKSEKEKSRNRGPIRLKGTSSRRQEPSKDVLLLRIQKLRSSFVMIP